MSTKLQLNFKKTSSKLKLNLKFSPKYNLGYACINITLSDIRPKAQAISVNNSCIQSTFQKKGTDHVIQLVTKNLKNVLKILEWNHAHNIRLYRLSSDMFPHITNPKFLPENPPSDHPHPDYAYSLTQFKPLLKQIGDYAKDHNIRLTFHPGQFNQIGAHDPQVFQKTIRELKFHADVLDLMELDLNSIMVIHGGGVYGDKPKTIKRWISQFHQLPECVKRRIVVENCERCYSVLDLLPICQAIKRPLIFDTHHHDCYSKVTSPLPRPDRQLMNQILDTWQMAYPQPVKPKFHISEQSLTKNRVGAHSDYVEQIPDYLLDLINDNIPIDLMIEAKHKENAVLYLRQKYE